MGTILELSLKPLYRHPHSWQSSPPDLDAVQSWESDALDGAEGQGLRSVLVQASMGTGKTVLAAKRARAIESRGRRMVFIAHLETLVDQAHATFQRWGVDAQIERGPLKAKSSFGRPPHIIASRDSLYPDRLSDMIHRTKLDTCEVEVVIDEAHLAASGAFLRPLAALRPVFAFGLSGTPWRLDGKPLVGPEAPFEALACRYDFLTACRHRNLVPPIFVECRGKIDLRDIAITKQRGVTDYDLPSLVKRINESLGHVCRAAKEQLALWEVKRSLLFLPDIGTCRAAESMMTGLGFKARAIYGEMPPAEKRYVKGAYHRGDLDILISCQMLDVGFDDPPTDGIILATPTKSAVKALQQGGRGSRLYPGKDRYVVIGYQWESADEGPQSTLDLLLRGVPDPAIRKRAGDLLRDRPGRNFLEAVEQAEIEEAQDRSEANRRRADLPVAAADQPAHYGVRLYDPLDLHSTHLDKMTRSQLRECGLEPKEIGVMTVGDADRFLEKWYYLRSKTMASYKQVRMLMRYGVPEAHAMAMTARQAKGCFYSMVKGRRGG